MARKARIEKPTTISDFVKETALSDRAAALALFLMDQGVGIFGRWRGRMAAEDQRALFGRFIGKGSLTVCGATEMVTMTVKACFGMDFSTEFDQPWRAIASGVLDHEYGIAQPYRYERHRFARAARSTAAT